VADVFGAHLSGLIAWLVWDFIHLIYLVTLHSRLLVFDSIGNSRSDIQPWIPINHRRCSTDLNFTQELSELRSGREIKPETVNVGR
jgi:hypothetical protein